MKEVGSSSRFSFSIQEIRSVHRGKRIISNGCPVFWRSLSRADVDGAESSNRKIFVFFRLAAILRPAFTHCLITGPYFAI